MRAGLGIGEGAAVLNLDAEDQFALRVERPDVGLAQIVLGRNAPDIGGVVLTAGAAAAHIKPFADAGRVEWKAHPLDELFDRARRFDMAEQDAVNAGRQDLFDHPCVVAYDILVDAVKGQRDQHRRRAVPGSSWPAGDQAAHEGVQPGDVEGLMLDADDQPVGVGLGRLDAALKSQNAAAVPVDRLSGFQKFDYLIDSFHCTLPVRVGIVGFRSALSSLRKFSRFDGSGQVSRYPATQSRSGCSRSTSGRRRPAMPVRGVYAQDHLHRPSGRRVRLRLALAAFLKRRDQIAHQVGVERHRIQGCSV